MSARSTGVESTVPGKNLSLNSGARLHVVEEGKGDELVLFLHAVGGDSSSWSGQLEFFSDKYTCVAFDMRGHNKSSLSDCSEGARNVSITDFAIDAIELIQSSGFLKAHLVGLSMGGVVALEIFKQRPDLVQSLCLANSWAHHPESAGRVAFMEERLAKGSLAESSRELIPDLFAGHADIEMIDAAIEVEASKDKNVFLDSWRSMFSVDYRAMVPSIDKPVLLIGGSADGVTPTEPLLTEIKEKLPLAQLIEIEGAGHFSNLDSAEKFNQFLSIHLRRARSKSGSRAIVADGVRADIEGEIVAHGLVNLLDRRGVDYFFSNSGTDFTPIIDAFGYYKGKEDFRLTPVVAPHENTAIAMAHGYFQITGRAQVVMGHVNVGTANMGLGIINARRAHIPVVVLSGNTPWYDQGIEGCRTNFVQWGQDTFDQSAYFREFTKWDYQLKGSHELETVVDRAFAIAQSDPAGPVYLTLPKEALCMPLSDSSKKCSSRTLQKPTMLGGPAPEAVAQAARLIAASKKPLIITAEAGRYPGAVQSLHSLVSRYAIPVIEFGKKNFFNFPTESPFHLGFEPSPFVEEADLIIALECPVPWIPALADVKNKPRMIHIGVDPLFEDLPMRAFTSDVNLVGSPDLSLLALSSSLSCLSASVTCSEKPFYKELEARKQWCEKEHQSLFESKREAASSLSSEAEIHKDYLSYCIGQVVDDNVVIFNEYNLDPFLVPRHLTDSWFENSIASGLGWSLGAALGAQLASPAQTMIATLGDGSYIFNTPLSAHYVASAHKLPVVIIVFNDNAWSTIKKSYKGSMPNGWAVKNEYMPLCDFDQPIALEKLAEAVGGIGIKVDKPGQLIDSLKRAIEISRTERKHVLVNVVCKRDG